MNNTYIYRPYRKPVVPLVPLVTARAGEPPFGRPANPKIFNTNRRHRAGGQDERRCVCPAVPSLVRFEPARAAEGS